ncbi:MAG: Crp/Fnr family transcriptional regulator [Roseicyclus sp.]|uniref:Crp/Fnr family transcriptional regulator n=1 Tax=Boseongicola sp. H5 TaxID=2763261 RepID=UPI001B29FE50|nr:Crp/Fnr family transcriptional regulator [Boseongicola sp. H5]MBO6602329.1 Crp/Fnr family transcriptional regulator [Roseicyclus sp.]MBO6623748.1 Crp/Fnr family transcriptional regulator [Roseicyclus sp.]MBO6922294.1 Crp/Fnr family transcriptional regulator [Roseicyclus sp.]
MGDAGKGWIRHFEGLQSLSEDMQTELIKGSTVVSVPSGTQVFQPGQPADNLLLLLEGTVRVHQKSDTGREVLLYRVHAGESCVLTTACMLACENYSADGLAESDVSAVAIPRATFDALAARSDVFRNFIFTAYSRRITALFTLIDDIVFRRLDVRLAGRLLELAGAGDVVQATHQMLATELGTAREVISRTLAEFQRRGWVEQSRGELRLVGRGGLDRLTRSAGEW